MKNIIKRIIESLTIIVLLVNSGYCNDEKFVPDFSSPQKFYETYEHAALNRDIDMLYLCLGEKSRDSLSEEENKKQIGLYLNSIVQSVTNHRITKIRMEKKPRFYDAVIEGERIEDGKRIYGEFYLNYENGQWKMRPPMSDDRIEKLKNKKPNIEQKAAKISSK